MILNRTLPVVFFLFFISMAVQAQTNDCTILLGPDITVCNNATFDLNPNGNQSGTYTWVGPAGLSCYNCPSPTVSGLITGMYTFIGTIQTSQCTKSDTIKITVVNGQQPKYNIANDQPICKGMSVALGGTPFANTFYQWTSSPPGLLSSQPNPSVTPPATTEYFLIAFNTSCPYVSVDSVLITVVDPPALNVRGDTSICNGESIVLGSTATEPGVNYAWTPTDGSLNSNTIANPLATPLQTTVYKLVATKSICMEMRTVTISVVNLNLDFNVDDTSHICLGTSLPISATLNPPGGAINWSPLAGLTISGGGTVVEANPTTSTWYTAQTAVPGCIRTRSIYVAVDSLPENLGIQPIDTTICLGAAAILSSPAFDSASYPDISFHWYPPLGQKSPDSLYHLTVQPNQTTTYFRATANGACRDTVSATVHVIVPPPMQIMPADTFVCAGGSMTLNAVYSPFITNLSWSPSTFLSCTECGTTIATPSNTTTYTISGTFQGCPVSASTVLNVRNPPVIQFPADLQICLGESLTLNQVADPAVTYYWTSTDPGFVPTNNPQPVVAPTQTATYTVQANNGCQSQSQVTVLVTSATLELSNDTTICKNFSAILTAEGSLPGTYQWSSGQTGQSVVVTPSQTTIYTVTYTYGDNCSLTGQVTVNLSGIGPEITFPADDKICPGENVLLNSTGTPGATYSWVSDPPGFTSSLATPQVSPNQSTQYTVTASLGNCTITKEIDIIAFNATLTMPPDVTICRGEEVSLIANGSLSGTYDWSSGQSTAIIDVSPSNNTTYDLVYTYGDGCTLEGAVQVTVKDSFSLKIISDPDTNRINLGDPLSLMGIIAPSQNLSAFQFQWLENGTETVGTTDAIQLVPVTEDSVISYDLIAIAPNGCQERVRATFTIVLPLVVVPNAFTPNKDGVNDLFRMKVIEGSAIVQSMEVYDRWGTKVFSSVEPQPSWDGTFEGKEAPSDVYVYVIRWQRGDGALQPPLIGDIVLLR